MGDYEEFMKMYKQNRREFIDEVIRRTAPFVLRRTKEEILKELPEKTETDIYLDLTEKQKALYTRTVKEIKGEIDRAYQSMTKSQAQVVVLSALMKLRRLCLSPALVDSSLPEESPKIELLLERLQLLMEQGHSALVFSQFTSYLDIVEKRLKKTGIRYLRLDGATPQKKRKQLVRKFQEGDRQRVFLLSLKAGGQGLNLTRATYVFHLDPW
jgi:non-specific serine/threonine protein kinase